MRAAQRLALAVALGAAPLSAATAQPLRTDDVARLDGLNAAAGAALREALATGSTEDLAMLGQVLHGSALPADANALRGEWTCRTMKLGGVSGLIVYPPFRCRGTRTTDGGILFEKTTGSQRVRGIVQAEGDRLLLAGVAYIAGDTPPAYDGLPARIDSAATPQILPAPGLVEVTGPNSARILFPYPLVESTLDILSLTR